MLSASSQPKRPTDRKALERQNKRKAGLVPIEIWTRQEHKQAIKEYAAKLNKPA